jgi:HNH endonuclease/NUMOD4 motif
MIWSAICGLCENEQPLANFREDDKSPTGHEARCRKCRNAGSRPLGQRLLAEKMGRDEAWLEAYQDDEGYLSQTTRGYWPSDERWRAVKNYLAQYEVSDKGRVRAHWEHRHGHWLRRPVPKLLKTYRHSFGYPTVALVDWITGDHRTCSVHVLVCEAYRGFCPPHKDLVGHRDGDPTNNRLENLEWITYTENEADKRRHQRMLLGERNHQAKLTDGDISEIRRMWDRGYESGEIAARFSISRTVAHKVATRRAWKHIP